MLTFGRIHVEIKMPASQIHTLTVSMKLNKTSETLRFEGNKIHCSSRDHSLSCLLYCKRKLSQKTRRDYSENFSLYSRATAVKISRVNVNSFPLTSYFSQCCPLMAFGGKQFHRWMSCDHELANEWASCSRKNASCIRKNYHVKVA